jgi:hypothetical protein
MANERRSRLRDSLRGIRYYLTLADDKLRAAFCAESDLVSKPRVLCRRCGKVMKQYPYGILAFSCSKCKLKAEITYSKMPEVRALAKEEKEKESN